MKDRPTPREPEVPAWWAAFTPPAWYARSRAVFYGGNQLRLLEGGQALFPAMVAAIEAARSEVWLASYIFHPDAAGALVARALGEAARRGVQVRVVVDGFGSRHGLPLLREWLAPAGVALVVYHPLERWWHGLHPQQLRRLHQKLCVVDGEHAFVGGINILDDLHDLRHGYSLHPRLDFAVALHGPVVQPVEQSVQAVWLRAHYGSAWQRGVLSRWQDVQRWANRASAQPVDEARRLWRRRRPAASATATPPPALGPVLAAFVLRDNLRQRRTIERTCLAAIGQARQRVDLVTPYFYPGHRLRRALVLAAQRGVRVRLLLQGKPDYRLAGVAARSLYAELQAGGVRIHEYTHAFLHAKAMVVDEEWATVGSSNLDPLSLLLNLEANVVVRDAAFNQQLSAAFERALREGAQPISEAEAQPAHWTVRLGRALVAGVARLYLRWAGVQHPY